MVLLASAFTTIAQTPWCHTTSPTQSEKGVFLQQLKAFESQRARMSIEGITNVAVKIHLVSRSNGIPGLSDTEIRTLMDSLNFDFINANIQFYLCGGVDYINDDDFYIFDTKKEDAFCKDHDVNNAINLYLVKAFTKEDLGGYAKLPAFSKASNRIFCAYSGFQDLVSKIAPHEMGHYFGLLHTFENASYPEYAEVVTRGENANCAYRGDLLCDTPADPFDKDFYEINACKFSSKAVDIYGEHFSPQVGNLMSYYRGCGNFFTPGQITMIKTGFIMRLNSSPFAEREYNFDCQGIPTQKLVTADVFVNGVNKNNGRPFDLCVDTPFTVTFTYTGNFANDNVFKVYLLSDDRTYSAEIGQGTTNQITCKIPKDAPLAITNSYRIQIASTNPVVVGIMGRYVIYISNLPTIELSGSYELFQNESINIPVKTTGGPTFFYFDDSPSFTIWQNHNATIPYTAQKIETLKVKRIWNACGDGQSKGQVSLNVVSKPIAKTLSVENLSGTYLCTGKPVMLNIKSNGIFGESNSFKIQLLTHKGEFIRDLSLEKKEGNLLKLTIPEDLAEGKGYKLKLISSNPVLETIADSVFIQSRITALLSGDTTIVNGQQAGLTIKFKGKEPFTLITSEGESIVSQENNFKWIVAPSENKSFSLRSVSNEACGNGEVAGSAVVKVNYFLKTAFVTDPYICAGSSMKVSYEIHENFSIDDSLIVQLSDATGKNFKTVPTIGTLSPLTIFIPENLSAGLSYRIRVISKSGKYIGRESNDFEIRKKPSAIINGFITGNKATNDSVFVHLTGGGPWEFSLSDNNNITDYSAAKTPFPVPIHLSSNTVYTLKSVSNACGQGSFFGQTTVNVRESSTNYCIPKVSYGITGRISRVRLTDMNGKMLLNSFAMQMGKNNYTDNTKMVVYLKPGNSYNYDLLASDDGNEYNHTARVTSVLIMWIDYDQNGVFDKNEIIVANAVEYAKAKFKIPENARRGITRMRVRSSTESLVNIIADACAESSSGETEDYTIYITDDSPAYTADLVMEEIVVCKHKPYTLPFSYSGTFSENNVFKVGLYNDFDNFLGYIGESKQDSIRITFPADIYAGDNYKLKLFASEPYFEGIFTKAFRINDFPTATLSGNQRAFYGQSMPLNIELDGGGDWIYKLGPGAGGLGGGSKIKVMVDYPAHAPYMINGPGIYNFKLDYVVNMACGEGTTRGSARVEVLKPDGSPTISQVKTNFRGWLFNQVVYPCNDHYFSNSKTINFKIQGKFNTGNFFTAYLINPDDQFVAAIGYSKIDEMPINIPSDISGFGYKIKVVSSDPYTESPLSAPFLVIPKFTAKMSGNSEIFPGEQATIKLELTGVEPWEIGLSDGTSFITNQPVQYLKVSPGSTQTYAVTSVTSYYCQGETSGTATVKVLSRASKISLKQAPDICAGGISTVGFKTNGSFSTKNNMRTYLSDKNGRNFKEIENKIVNDSVINLTIPAGLAQGNGYRVKLISTSPYLESEPSNAFALGSQSTATLSGDERMHYENMPFQLKVEFSGNAPYSFELSDGTKYTDVSQNPFIISLNAEAGANTYTIKNISDACGQGNAIGKVVLDIIPLPIIKTEKLVTETVCQGQSFLVPFTTNQSKFQSDNTFKVEIANLASNSFKEIKSINKGDSLFIITDQTTPAGKYKIRVVSTNPEVVGSTSVSELSIKTLPKARIDGGNTIFSGDSARYFLTFSGESPYTVSLSNGTELTNVMTDSLVIAFLPKKSETITITSIKNTCGEGSFSGKAFFEVLIVSAIENDGLENQVEIYPIPFEQSTSLYIASTLLSKSPAFEISDILGRKLMKQPIVHATTPIDLNFYPAGIYYVRVMINEKQFLRKIVK